MKTALRALIVEDSQFDAQMMVSILRKGGYDVVFDRVETSEAMQAALTGKLWDIVLADYNLPEFNAPAALTLLQQSGLDLPFIIVSGGIGEDIAVASMKAGAHDYLMKGNLNRLAPAIERELRYRLLWESSPDAVLLMDSESHRAMLTIRSCLRALKLIFLV